MQKINLDTARALVDFSGKDNKLASLGEQQLRGAVRLHNMIAEQGLGYLADEVGMGKTYVALGIVTMLRYFNPRAKVLYVIPSTNVQEKWYGEYSNFVETNVLVSHDRVRSVDGSIAVEQARCGNLFELINKATTGHYSDFFTRMSSFSFGLRDDPETLNKSLVQLRTLIPALDWDDAVDLTKQEVKDRYARALN